MHSNARERLRCVAGMACVQMAHPERASAHANTGFGTADCSVGCEESSPGMFCSGHGACLDGAARSGLCSCYASCFTGVLDELQLRGLSAPATTVPAASGYALLTGPISAAATEPAMRAPQAVERASAKKGGLAPRAQSSVKGAWTTHASGTGRATKRLARAHATLPPPTVSGPATTVPTVKLSTSLSGATFDALHPSPTPTPLAATVVFASMASATATPGTAGTSANSPGFDCQNECAEGYWGAAVRPAVSRQPQLQRSRPL